MSKAAFSACSRTIRDSRSIGRLLLVRGVLILAAALVSAQASAQAPDTTSVVDSAAVSMPSLPDSSVTSDSLVVRDTLTVPDSLAAPASARTPAGPPMVIDSYRSESVLDTIPLVKTYVPDVPEWLDALPGVFRYTTGNLGWPDQVAFRGLPPRHTGLTLDGLPMHDPVTGRALFELLPFDLLDAPSAFAGRHSAGPGAAFATRRFDIENPYTELRYRVGGPGLQSISATHVQQRRVRLLGSAPLLQVVFRFASGGWDGAYPDSFSDLTQLDGRIGLRSEHWAVRLTNFLTRRHGGAHGGVIVPTGGDPDTIYDTFEARVRNPNATFRTKRSDIRLAVERALLPGLRPFSAEFSWVSHVRRYRNVEAPESLIHEYAISADQELPGLLETQYVAVRTLVRFDDVRSSSVFRDSTALGRSHFEGLLESSIPVGEGQIAGHFGFANTDGYTLPRISVSAKTGLMGMQVSGELAWSGRVPSRLEVAGSHHIGQTEIGGLEPEKTQSTVLAVGRSFGSTSVHIELFAASLNDPLDFRQVAADTFDVAQSSFGLTRFGLSVRMGWRDLERRGLYGVIQTTAQGADTDAEGDAFLQAIEKSVPSTHGRVRLGARYVLFQGDLDIDMYVVGRFWSSFQSRIYDPTTGVLALAAETAPEIESRGTLDVRVEAGIRSATVYVGMENVLASVSYPGAMVLPQYPLPAQAFRFGVFWPIDN